MTEARTKKNLTATLSRSRMPHVPNKHCCDSQPASTSVIPAVSAWQTAWKSLNKAYINKLGNSFPLPHQRGLQLSGEQD